MRTLITGGSGFVARHLAPALHARGDELVNLDLVAPASELPYARTVRGDVRDPHAVATAMRGCGRVVHLAAAHHDFGLAEGTYRDVNEGGTQCVCDAMSAADARTLVFFSSVAVYGDAPPDADESTPAQPRSAYGVSKLAAERTVARWVGVGTRRAVVLRPVAIFGEHHFANMYVLIRQIASGRYLHIGSGANRKSLASVHNVVAAVLFLLSQVRPAPLAIYNYADKPDLASAELAALIHAELGRALPRVRLPLPVALALAAPLDVLAAATGRRLAVSRARIRKLAADETTFAADAILRAGFRPAVGIEDSLRAMVRWFVDEGHALDHAPRLPPARPAYGAADAAGRG